MSAVAEIADAVKAALNTAFAGTFTATRVYLPRVQLDEMGSAVSVKVVPVGDDRTLETRGGLVRRDIPISVGVQKRLDTGTDPDAETANAQIDTLMELVEDIADALKPGTAFALTGDRRAVVIRTVMEPFPLREHLDQMSVFTSAVVATLRLT